RSISAILMIRLCILQRDHCYTRAFPTRRSSDLQDPSMPVKGPARLVWLGPAFIVAVVVGAVVTHSLRDAREAQLEIGRTLVEGGGRKSTRLNSSHGSSSCAGFCVTKKTRGRSRW